jgi:hypothetical protein
MKQTELDRSARLAAALFDEVVIPLAKAKRGADSQVYFPLRPEAQAKSYFEPASTRTMNPSDFEFPGGGAADGFIDALAAFWAAQGETELAATAGRLKEIADALGDEVSQDDGSVNILCYTLF